MIYLLGKFVQASIFILYINSPSESVALCYLSLRSVTVSLYKKEET